LILAKCTGVRNLAFWRPLQPREDMRVIPLPSTLCILLTNRLVIRGLADSSVVFPNMKLIAVRSLPRQIPIPTLSWLPSLTTVRLDIEYELFPVLCRSRISRRSSLSLRSLNRYSWMLATFVWIWSPVSLIKCRFAGSGAAGAPLRQWD